MLYRAVEGCVKESHYGLALAHVVPLPPKVLSDATYFAHKLERRLMQKKKTSKNVINERRRKLILDLKEHLVQAYSGTLQGDLLANWLRELQKEFVNRMTAINQDERRVFESEDEDEEVDMEMMEDSMEDQPDQEMVDAEEVPATATESRERVPGVVSVGSRVTSTEPVSTTRQASGRTSSVRAISENLF